MEVCWKLYNIKLENRPYTEVSLILYFCIMVILQMLPECPWGLTVRAVQQIL